MTTKTRYFRKPLALLMCAALGASMMILLASRAQATDFLVTNTANSGAGSLPQAILDANANAGADTISFQAGLSGTITLAATLDVTDSAGLTIDGEDAEITVSGGGSVRVFSVASGANLDLRNLTVAGGFTNDNLGGGIHNAGTLEVTNSTFSGNSANLTLGGGIVNAGTLTVTNSTFSGNSAPNAGGAIYTNANSPVTVTNSTFSGNLAAAGDAIHNDGDTSNVGLRNTIVASPRNNNCGGALPTDNGGNLDDGDTCGFTASTSKSNTPAGLDPAGLKDNGGPTQTIALCSGVDTPAGCTGPSAAIDAAVNCPPPDTDQRGVSRPQGSACDIGAYEVDVADTTPPTVTKTSPPLEVPPPPNNVSKTADVFATFSEDVQNVSPETFFLERQIAVKKAPPKYVLVDATVSLSDDGTFYVLNPVQDLPKGEYRATITTEVTDLADNALEEPVVWTFTVRK
jgi:predicted outer membrane repeat protein